MIKKFETGIDFSKLKWTPPQALQAPQVRALSSETFGTFGGCSAPVHDFRKFEMPAASVKVGADVPLEWEEGFAALSTMNRPADISKARWFRVIHDAEYFIDQWAAQAARLGWSTLEVFGVNRIGTGHRFDGRGLLASLNGRQVISISRDSARVSTSHAGALVFRRKPTCREGEQVPLWGCRAANDNTVRQAELFMEGGAGQIPLGRTP